MNLVAEVSEKAVTVVVPIEIRRRNGRPTLVVPEADSREQSSPNRQATAAVARAIARAWDWRRRLKAEEARTLQDIASAEKVTLPFVSRFVRLAYLSPAVLYKIVAERHNIAVSIDRLTAAALEPWAKQPPAVFELSNSNCHRHRRTLIGTN